MERLKNELRNKLKELSKDELVDIIADFCSLYVYASNASGLYATNRIQDCLNNVQTDLRKTENLNEQKINDNFWSDETKENLG